MDPGDRLKAALADRYAIESEIDSGGMATVYRAGDLKHDRTVAIKVLRPELAEAIGTDRFLREIRTTANLNHPHILPLHDSGEADGFLFYVMPFVQGESLRDRLEREGQLPVEDAVEIARELADALAYAHKRGVIHRDVKPANILLEEGQAFLADFGIAQARAGAEETQLTTRGMSLGTPSYMSPEQVSGAGELDGRADQYALGCVLYEMLAGHPPFSGADIQAVMRQHLAVDAPTVTQARATVPKGVAKALHRSLAKSPADRFRTMSELEAALAGATLPLLARIPMGKAKAAVFAGTVVIGLAIIAVFASVWSPRGPEAPELVSNRVVVLPFENRVNDPDLADLGDLSASLVGEAIHQLELADQVPYDMSRDYAEEAVREGAGDLTRRVAERTGAGLAVTGTVRRVGDSLRFQLNVTDMATGVTLQPVTETGPVDQRMEVIARLGDRVAGGLALILDPYMEMGRQAESAPPLLDAYRRYKAGFRALEQGEAEEALGHHLAAYDIDSVFVPALVAAAYMASAVGDHAKAESLAHEADLRRDRLNRFHQLDLDNFLFRLSGELWEVLENSRENHRLDPAGWSPLGHALAALAVNRPGEAIEALEDYDPYPEWRLEEARRYWRQLCDAHHMLGNHDQELVAAQEARTLYPDDPGVLRRELLARAALGQLEEVSALLDETLVSSSAFSHFFLTGLELRAHGYPEAARETFERGVDWLQNTPAEEVNSDLDPRWLLGFMLYRAEDWEEAREFIHALSVENPENPMYLSWDGASAARMGDTATAREISVRLAELMGPDPDPDDLKYRARLAAVLGDSDEAMRLIRSAISAGMPFGLDLHRDQDLESLRDREDWQELMRPKG